MTEQKKRYLVRADEWKGMEGAVPVRHPLNPNSHVDWMSLSDRAGMQRAHVAIGRIPPGKESFIYHSHSLQEEWLFILEGRGRAEIGADAFEVGPGDYMGFPTDGTGHHLINNGESDLLYLMGGERTDVEVARFPKQKKLMVAKDKKIALIDETAIHWMTIEDWVKQDDA